MKKVFPILFFVLFASSITAAADDYRVVSIQVLKAAQYPVPFAGRTLAIYAMQYVTDVNGMEYTFRNDTLLAREAALGIKGTLEEWEAFADYDVPVYDFFAFCNSNDECNDRIDSVKGYNILILVRNISVLPYQRVEKQYTNYYGEYYNVGTYAPYTATFEVYDADSTKLLYKETLSDTLLWDKNALDYKKVIETLPTPEEAAKLAASEIGKKYAEKLVPHWTSVQRFFFVPSGKDLKQAANYAEALQWDEAMKIWEQYAGSTNRKVAGQAAFNMALGCEMNGRYELAMEWLAFAEKTYPIKEIAGYRAILQRRIAESKTLEQQLQDL